MRDHLRTFAVITGALIFSAALSPARSLAETRLGIKGGATFASYDLGSSSGLADIGNRDGYAVALELEYSLSPSFRLFVEPTYAEKGGTVDFISGYDFADNTQKWDYLVVPVGIKGLIDLGPVRPFARLGLGVAFLVNNETDMKNGTTSPDVDIKDNDVTAELGAGVEIPANEAFAFTVEGRYAQGLSNISPTNASDSKTQTWLVLGGVSFRL